MHSFSSLRRRAVAFVLLFVAAAPTMLLGCGNEACDPEMTQRAVYYLHAHRECQTDEDCVIVPDYCGELPGGFCGQLVMSRAGANSAEWKAFDRELRDCGPSECTQCLAAVTPGCTDGVCGGFGVDSSDD